MKNTSHSFTMPAGRTSFCSTSSSSYAHVETMRPQEPYLIYLIPSFLTKCRRPLPLPFLPLSSQSRSTSHRVQKGKSRRRLTHAHESLDTDHPITTLIDFVGVDVHLDLRRAWKVAILEGGAQLCDLRHRIRLQ